MSIVRWKPFGTLHDLIEDIPFNTFQLETCDLAVDISENDVNVFVEIHIPGIDPDEVSIEIEDNHLHIIGSRQEEHETKDRNYYHKEIKRGSFERVVSLPCAVESKDARAEYKDGTLRLTLPKIQQSKRKKINIDKV
jgi:HSP20 family protein